MTISVKIENTDTRPESSITVYPVSMDPSGKDYDRKGTPTFLKGGESTVVYVWQNQYLQIFETP